MRTMVAIGVGFNDDSQLVIREEAGYVLAYVNDAGDLTVTTYEYRPYTREELDELALPEWATIPTHKSTITGQHRYQAGYWRCYIATYGDID